MNETQKVFIVEAAEQLNRRPATIRAWERQGMLPKRLRPQRSDRGWRFWSPAQIEDIKRWMIEEDLRPGKGLVHYQPTPDQVASHLEGQRLPRKNRDTETVAV